MTDASRQLRLYNTLTRTKEVFTPIDPQNVRMYVCGPTVYDFAHIGNARPVIVFDVLFRLLRHLYGADHVTYVRNITDVDDKINARALRDYGKLIKTGKLSLNEAIRKVTEKTAGQFHRDVVALGCLEPTHEPRATEFVLPRPDGKTDMVAMIQSLIDGGHAYEAKGESGREILFDTTSMPEYGQLSHRNLDEQQAGARVAVEAHKRHPADFVLWKESSDGEPGWVATFRVGGNDAAIRGRPGWHIECSAMSDALLWQGLKDRLSPAALARPHQFDIHGGGLDLIFPHHENEIAQSRCAHGTPVMANVWMHNGFLQVEGKKMAKSEGNFVTIHDLLNTENFGGFVWPGAVVRYAMLKTHYRQPIDFSVASLEEASTELSRFWHDVAWVDEEVPPSEEFLAALGDDLNFPQAIAELHRLSTGTRIYAEATKSGDNVPDASAELGSAYVNAAKVLANLKAVGIDLKSYNPHWVQDRAKESVGASDAEAIETCINKRLSLIREKNWAEADRIRDELLAQGIQLKDSKDPETGERITTWEVKR